MTKLTMPRNRFNLDRFLEAVDKFTISMGGDESFPIVQDGVAVYDFNMNDMMEDESEIPDDPVERLESGHTLFCQFAVCRDFDLLVCADGTEIEVPSLDEDDEEEAETDEEGREDGDEDDTCCDENRSYGFLLSLVGREFVIESALMCDLNGDVEVEIVKDAGRVDGLMGRWIKSFLIPKRTWKA